MDGWQLVGGSSGGQFKTNLTALGKVEMSWEISHRATIRVSIRDHCCFSFLSRAFIVMRDHLFGRRRHTYRTTDPDCLLQTCQRFERYFVACMTIINAPRCEEGR